MGCLEATGGFEPPNRAFAELRLNHLATSPQTILPRFWCRGGDLNSYGFAPTAPSRPRVYQFHHLGTAPAWGLAGVGGLEPPTCGFGDRCSSQLSYTPALPMTEPAGASHSIVRNPLSNLPTTVHAPSWFQPNNCATNQRGFVGGWSHAPRLQESLVGTPGRIRTRDPLLRRQPLYPLSYWGTGNSAIFGGSGPRRRKARALIPTCG